MPIFRSAGDNRWLTYGLTVLARVRTGQERPAEARALLEEARLVWSRVRTTYGQPFDAYLRYYLGSAALAEGDADAAREHSRGQSRLNSTPPTTTCPALSCSGASGCWPHGGASTPRRGPGSPRACRCCARGATSRTWPCRCSAPALKRPRAASPAARALLTEALQAWQRLGGNAGMALALPAGGGRSRPRSAAPGRSAARSRPGVAPGERPPAPRHRAV